MSMDETLRGQWLDVVARLQARQLLAGLEPTVSIRIPGSDDLWFGTTEDATPRRVVWRGSACVPPEAELHAAIYTVRGDVGAIAAGGGEFGQLLGEFGGVMPGVFDEQVRHL